MVFNTHNLKSVSQVIKEKYPNIEIIITADNDIKIQEITGKNTGIESAKKATRTIDSSICIYHINSDFNDLFIEK